MAVALIRGLTRKQSNTLGNFWADLARIVTRILLPIAVIAAIVLIAQGAEQNLHATHMLTTLPDSPRGSPEGRSPHRRRSSSWGRTAADTFNANAGHPFENPTGLTNMLSNWLLLCIPFALAWTFGKMARDRKQGYAVLGAMAGLFAIGALLIMPLEAAGNVHVTQAHVSQAITLHLAGRQHGGQGGAERSRSSPHCSTHRRPATRPDRSTRPTTATPRSAEGCSSST